MRESWTDERLDDFRSDIKGRFDAVDKRFEQVDKRFDRVEDQIQGLRAETRAEFSSVRAEMKGGFEAQGLEMKHGFEAVNDRFDKMYRVLIGSTIAIAVALLSAPHL